MNVPEPRLSQLDRVYLRRLRDAQLRLSLLAAVPVAGFIGALPLVLYLVPSLARTEVLGVPVAIALILVPPYALFVVLGWLYRRRADALDAELRRVMEGGE